MKPPADVAGLPVRLIDLGSVDYRRSQAVYHALAETMAQGSPDTMVLVSPASRYLCLGYHQPFHAVLDGPACDRLGLPVLRRRVGGGATYLDRNQLFYQFIFHHRRVPANFEACYAYLLAAPVAALRRMGLPAQLAGVNEVEVGGRRVAGIGGGRIGEAAVVVGNFLLDFDYRTMTQVWRAPREAFRDLAARALRERVATLKELLGNVALQEVRAAPLAQLPAALGRPIAPGELTPAEEPAARETGERLESEAFVGRGEKAAGPMQSLKISARAQIHAREARLGRWNIHASLYALEETLAAARLEPEPARSWTEAEKLLAGKPLAGWEQHLTQLLG